MILIIVQSKTACKSLWTGFCFLFSNFQIWIYMNIWFFRRITWRKIHDLVCSPFLIWVNLQYIEHIEHYWTTLLLDTPAGHSEWTGSLGTLVGHSSLRPCGDALIIWHSYLTLLKRSVWIDTFVGRSYLTLLDTLAWHSLGLFYKRHFNCCAGGPGRGPAVPTERRAGEDKEISSYRIKQPSPGRWVNKKSWNKNSANEV